MYYALKYELSSVYKKSRDNFRAAHLSMVSSLHKEGILLLGGAFEEPNDAALIIFKAEDSKIVRDFVKHDPYVINGLVKSWEIRKWKVVIGDK